MTVTDYLKQASGLEISKITSHPRLIGAASGTLQDLQDGAWAAQR